MDVRIDAGAVRAGNGDLIVTAHAFLPTDQEERDELAQLTGSLERPTSDAELDAVASFGLRIMLSEQAEIARYMQARDAELRRISAIYETYITPHRDRYSTAEKAVEECAMRAQFVGKAKSRKVANGTYGRRQVPESVKIVDRDTLIPWLLNHYPAVVTEEIEKVVAAKDVKPVVLQHMKLYEGEIAPGVEYSEAKDETFAKPFSQGGE